MRRGLARRMIRRAARGAGILIPPLLIRSNELLASGNFAQAADALEELAGAAQARGGPRAARFFLEAGRARVYAGQSEAGLGLLKLGLQMLSESGRQHRLARVGQRILVELAGHGLTSEAEKMRAFLAELGLGPGPLTGQEATPARPPLPTHCPGCGAPVRSDEVEWLDAVTAECDYCGSPVRTQ